MKRRAVKGSSDKTTNGGGGTDSELGRRNVREDLERRNGKLGTQFVTFQRQLLNGGYGCRRTTTSKYILFLELFATREVKTV